MGYVVRSECDFLKPIKFLEEVKVSEWKGRKKEKVFFFYFFFYFSEKKNRKIYIFISYSVG